MKVELWLIGKTSHAYLQEGMALYEKRLKRYLPFQIQVIPDLKKSKNLAPTEIKKKEGEAILQRLQSNDFLILFDERGKSFTSLNFAQFMEQKLHFSNKRLIFLVGGAYGFSEAIYRQAQQQISLSKMTFSHQMIRLFVLEQLYRSMTILKGEPYHNE